MTFIDVDPSAVIAAGRATAATSTDWEAWAGHAESLLRDVAGGTGDEFMDAGFADYLSTWNPTMRSAATRAFALGANAAGGAGLVTDGDHTAAHTVGTFGATVERTTQLLSRPINA